MSELDDEFAKDVSEYDTVQELKDATIERLQETASMQAVNEAKDKLIEKVFETQSYNRQILKFQFQSYRTVI